MSVAGGDGRGNSSGAAGGARPTVDAQSPWLGLASFTEETRGYFYGRDEEIAELARRVQRKLLTVLFGQSGLGKTSILRAGLVPRLRGQGYCPVYVRIDYGRESPEPADQIKAAIAGTARGAGEWSQAGVAIAGESLWEYLHHRDDVLRDEAGNTLIPLLIFDQFEEIFTLAQTMISGGRGRRGSSPILPISSRTGLRGNSRRSSKPTSRPPSASTSRAAIIAC